jgi:hypothetical protein
VWSERALPRPVVLVGGLIPDLVKIELGFDLLGIAVEDFIAPLHHTFFQRKEPALRNTFFHRKNLY